MYKCYVVFLIFIFELIGSVSLDRAPILPERLCAI